MTYHRSLIVLLVVGVFLWLATWFLATPRAIVFSDAVKFGDSARNLLAGYGRGIHHSFFCARCLEHYQPNQLFSPGFLPVISFAYLPLIKLLGATDLSLALTSGVFYLLSIVLTFFIGQKVFNQTTGFWAALIFAFHPQILDLAVSGASETLFIFLLLSGFLFLLRRSRISYSVAIIFLILAFFTRHQAFVLIGGFIVFWILQHFSGKQRFFAFIFLTVFTYLTTRLLHLLSNINPEVWYSPLSSIGNIVYNSPLYPANSALRSTITIGSSQDLLKSFIPLASKIFYNFYNFAKNFWNLATPAFSVLFLLSLFYRLSNKKQRHFRLTSVLIILGLYLSASITIPNFRYVLPVLPFVSILAADFLLRLPKSKLIIPFLILATLGTTGHIFIDYRFRAKQFNLAKPTINRLLATQMAKYVAPGKLVVTNLDAWAAWYQGLTTVWFPLEPRQLITPGPKGPQLGPIQSIFLTDYKNNDADFQMGESWRQALYHPETLSPTDPVFSHFFVRDQFIIEPETNYDKLKITGIVYQRLN